MDIKVTDLRKFLKEEFGIKNDEEFEMAINTSIGVDLGLFTQLYKDVIKEERTWWYEKDTKIYHKELFDNNSGSYLVKNTNWRMLYSEEGILYRRRVAYSSNCFNSNSHCSFCYKRNH